MKAKIYLCGYELSKPRNDNSLSLREKINFSDREVFIIMLYSDYSRVATIYVD